MGVRDCIEGRDGLSALCRRPGRDDDVIDSRALGDQPGQAGCIAGRNDDDLLVRIVDDVDDLIVGKMRVQGAKDGSHAGRGEKHFEVLRAIVHHGSDALVGVDTAERP